MCPCARVSEQKGQLEILELSEPKNGIIRNQRTI